MRKAYLAVALSVGAVLSGCAARVGYGYNVYDPYYGDYHVWTDPEPLYYNQWIIETHRPHRDFRKLRPQQQREYWNWRHSRPQGQVPAPRPGGPPRGRRR